MLARSPVDLAMRSRVQPIFEGAPDLGPGLAQTPRLAVANNGGALDTVRACKPLSAAEEAEYKRRVADAKAAKRPEADRRRDEWVDARVAAMVAKGMHRSRGANGSAERRNQNTGGGRRSSPDVLPHLFKLEFAELGVVTVADVLANPELYIEKTLADPHEGVEYGRQTAILYKGPVWAMDKVVRSRRRRTITSSASTRAEDVFEEPPRAHQGPAAHKKPVIQMVAGEIARIVDESEAALDKARMAFINAAECSFALA